MGNKPYISKATKPFILFSTGCISDTQCGTAYFLASEETLGLEQLRASYTRPVMRSVGHSLQGIKQREGEDYLACYRFVAPPRPGEPKKMESIVLGGFPVAELTTQQKSGLMMFLQNVLEQDASHIKGHADLHKNDMRGSQPLQKMLETLLPQLPQHAAQGASTRWCDHASQPSPAKGWFQL